MMFACWHTTYSNKRRQGSPLNPKTRNRSTGTNLLTRGVPTPFLSHKIHPLPFHIKPQQLKEPKHLKIGLIPIQLAIEDVSNAKDLGT